MLLIAELPEGTFVSQILRDEKNKNPYPFSRTVFRLSFTGPGNHVHRKGRSSGTGAGE